jgi:hypothetical protein
LPTSELAGDFDERLKVSRDIRRRELISPYLIASSFKFPIFDNAVDEKTNNAVNQGSNYGQLGNNGSPVKRTNGLAEDGKIFFKSAVGSLGKPNAMQTSGDSDQCLLELQE